MMSARLAFSIVFLSLAAPLRAGEADGHFIVFCSLFGPPDIESTSSSKPVPKPHDLNLLVDHQVDKDRFNAVIETFDPDNILMSGVFVKAFFENMNTAETRFTALTGSVRDTRTRLLGLTKIGNSEYSAILGDVGKREKAFSGRCWMSNIDNAAAEFEKLKVKETSQ
ncbi:hypothetical protein [Sphingobium sp. CR28]|uniref:hypothetical protein n=1 Tax=Sphingobium sp. CR28 TaxID=3400272 RepID=UPI003FF0D3EE